MKLDKPPLARRNPNFEGALNVLRDRIAANPVEQIKEVLLELDDVAAELFREAPIPGARLQGQDLTGLDFTGADLTGADFTGALIAGARFDTARVTQGQLREARDWTAHVSNWTLSPRPLSASLGDGDRFAVAPFAPELVLLPSHLAIDSECPIGVHRDEWIALAEGRLAMAVMPVSASQFSFHLAAVGKSGWSDAEHSTTKEMSIREARDYLVWVRLRSSADFRVPSHGLLVFVARKGWHDGAEHAAITVETSRGLDRPARANLDAPIGQGRCNRLGLHDIYGNAREFVDIGKGDRELSDEYHPVFASVGGCFRETNRAAFDLQKHRHLHVTGREHALRLILLLRPEGSAR